MRYYILRRESKGGVSRDREPLIVTQRRVWRCKGRVKVDENDQEI